MADGEAGTSEPLGWRYANHNRIEQGDYSELDKPPALPANPRDVVHNVARLRRASRLRTDASILQNAARIAEFHGCPATSNANARLANTLSIEADKIFKPSKDIQVSPQYKDKI